MKFRLYDKATDNIPVDITKKILKHRGIDDTDTYLNLSEDVIIDYNLLENMEESIALFDKHFQKRNCIGIIPDSDVDGQCSSAELFLYIKRMDNDYPIKIIYHIKPKAHNLSDVEIPDDIKLLIIADAGTNDIEECRKLKDKGIDIIILDHHEEEEDNPYALIINNQCSDKYINKQLCGGGIVYRWLQALDDYYWNEFADDYLDLVAFSNISDVMDMRSFETRYFVNCGLLNIKNKFLQALIKAQDYSMNGKINIHNVQWYLTPVVNALIRIGSLEEKELLFKAFIEQDEYFEYKKRATKDSPSEIIQESIYDRAARLCKNAKSRQDKLKEKAVKQITEIVEHQNNDNKVTIVDTSEILDSGLTGVVAIKIAEMFNKPCILLNKFINENSGNKFLYSGSGRNINHSPIENFKDIVNRTEVAEARGHANAFGVINLETENMEIFSKQLNTALKDVEYDSTYKVDFIIRIENMNIGLVNEFSKFEDITGQGIEEPIIAVTDITLLREDFEIFGKNEDTISFVINDIKYIQFKCKEGNLLYDWLQDAWCDQATITFNIVGKPTINEYNGIRTPQVVIEDVDVIFTEDSKEEW